MTDTIVNAASFRRRLAVTQARDTFHSLLRTSRHGDLADRQAAFGLACEHHDLDEVQAHDLAAWLDADQLMAAAKIA
jgi:hypothetical protein